MTDTQLEAILNAIKDVLKGIGELRDCISKTVEKDVLRIKK